MKHKIIIIILMLFLVTGCWDYNELNKLAIVTGMAIDKEDDQLKVSILISNSKKNESINNEEADTVIYTGKGDSLPEALKEISLTSPKKLYLGHLSVIIVSDVLAKEGLSNISDYLLREPETIKSFYMILSKDTKAHDILSILSPLEDFPSQTIYKNITTSSDSTGLSLAVPYTDFIIDMLATGKNSILPSIVANKNISDDDKDIKSSSLKISNIGVFKNDKLVGYLSNKASRGVSILKKSVNQMSLEVSCNGGKVVTNIKSLNSKLKIKKDKKNIDINVTGTAYLKNASCNLDLNDTNNINKLERKIEDSLKMMILNSISETKKLKSDVLGYGELMYKYNYEYFNKVKNSWDDKIYPTINSNVNVNIKLISNGSIDKTIKEVISEK